MKKTLVIVLGMLFFLTAACAAASNYQDAASASNLDNVTPTFSAKATPKSTDTVSQKNAIRAANNYLEVAGFCKSYLEKTLISGNGFSKSDAHYAVNHLGKVDWNVQAARIADNYVHMTGYSRSGLIAQMSSPYGDRCTKSQAVYAANRVGL